MKVLAQNLESALAGSALYKITDESQIPRFQKQLKDDFNNITNIISLKPQGVGVASSTLGSLEALLLYLKKNKININSICIGNVSKKDLIKVMAPFE